MEVDDVECDPRIVDVVEVDDQVVWRWRPATLSEFVWRWRARFAKGRVEEMEGPLKTEWMESCGDGGE